LAKKDISQVKPRETAGRDTTLRYDYQFRQTAEAALEILEDKDVVCVFCDLHDDFVVQRKTDTSAKFDFDFNQVKTKKDPKHQWDIPDTFGINEERATPASKPAKSMGGKLFYHQLAFDESCRSVSIVTNVFFVDDIERLIREVQSAKDITKLTGTSKKWFEKIFDGYKKAHPTVDEKIIFTFLKKFKLRSNAGPLIDEKQDHAAIFLKRIYEYSEVIINQPQAMRIYKELIEKVRSKAMAEILPTITAAELQKSAGIMIEDLLSLLSISKKGYEILKSGGDPKALKTASRLKHFIEECGGDETLVELACEAKISWESWMRQNRHTIGALDLSAMSKQCLDLLASQSTIRRNLVELRSELEDISRSYSGRLKISITKDLVFGLLLSLQVREELK
jgi:hypothetical protein